jgi:hypothetical protein
MSHLNRRQSPSLNEITQVVAQTPCVAEYELFQRSSWACVWCSSQRYWLCQLQLLIERSLTR